MNYVNYDVVNFIYNNGFLETSLLSLFKQNDVKVFKEKLTILIKIKLPVFNQVISNLNSFN